MKKKRPKHVTTQVEDGLIGELRSTLRALFVGGFHGDAATISDAIAALTTQAETIRRLEAEHLIQLGEENAAYQREYRRAEDAAETIRRLEGEVARLRGEIDQIVADKYPAPPNWYLVKVGEQRQLAEQRAEAAEGL